MNIWFAGNINTDSRGGVNRSMSLLASGLKDKGHTTGIIYSNKFDRGNFILFSIRLLTLLIRNIRTQPDWIIARSSDGLLCAIITRMFRMKTKVAIYNHGWEEFVYQTESLLPKYIITSPTTWKAKLFRFPMLKLTLFNATLCISGTVLETRKLKDIYKKHSTKIRYLPNGIITKGSGHWVNNIDTSDSLLCVGGLTWKKNIDYAIEVHIKLKILRPNTKLYLIGTGVSNEKLYERYDKIETKSIINVQSVSMDDMDYWYQKCSYVIAPSRYEGGHPFTILEAMKNGCIVFTSPIFAYKEIINNKKNGYFIDCLNPFTDAKIIAEYMSESSNSKEVRKRAISTAKRNSISRQCKRLDKILHDFL